ncbi:gluconokinase [Hydrocarboniphaga sp.]|uniref:gluconokinase n=1 Tax=Hydrocarboniphaga sp. TaxID=2033016 RepID=UPI003D12EA50
MSPKQPVQIVVVMGVSGSGKSTVAGALAQREHWAFQEGDDLHPQANRDRMHRGIALTDADRAPWLAALEQWIDARVATGESGVLTCSALKRAYRDQLAHGRPQLSFVYLRASEALIAERLKKRKDHFMSPALLHSQFETLEHPGADEPVMIVDVDSVTADQTVAKVMAAL